ncbi:MAG TPA: acyl-CoA dehydrogenase [Croceicoccus sp.]|nr:acyl-CoA dehydrogenase [Croceicoccus sp.]
MDFALNEEQQMIAETARAFFAENATSEATRVAMAADGIDRATWKAFCEDLGLAGLTAPEAFDGAGLGMVELATVAEAAGAQVAAVPLLGHVMAIAAVDAGGDEAQKAEWLPRLAAGEIICAVGFAEDLTGEATLAGLIALVPHGAGATHLLVLGKDRAALVDLVQSGVKVAPRVTMDQTRPYADIAVNDVAAAVLADPVAARDAALAAGWLCLSAEALGAAQAALDKTVAYAKERVQFGRPIGSFQAYKHRLADMMVEIEQARSAVYWAACAIDEGDPQAPLAIHSAKAFCADTARMVAGNMIQLHGGIGFTWEHDAHLYFKRARAISTLLGDGDWHREQVAKLTIGAPA